MLASCLHSLSYVLRACHPIITEWALYIAVVQHVISASTSCGVPIAAQVAPAANSGRLCQTMTLKFPLFGGGWDAFGLSRASLLNHALAWLKRLMA